MLGTDIAMNHQVALARHQEFLAEAEKMHAIQNAYGDRVIIRRSTISQARAAIASLLLRTGSWLMPDEHCQGLELRPGR